MADRLAHTLSQAFHKLVHRKEAARGPSLEDVQPEHPDDYPARHLKEMLDERRADFQDHASRPIGQGDVL